MNIFCKIKLIWSVLLVLFFCNLGWTCFYYDKKNKASEVFGTDEVFLFRANGNAHLVLKMSLDAKKVSSRFARILPLPALPISYEEIDGPLFMELRQLAPSSKRNEEGSSKGYGRGDGEGLGGAVSKLKVHSIVSAGKFEIQPIEILKEGSREELNQWLKKNKFIEVSHNFENEYLKKGAVFLAIRITLDQPSAQRMESRPLHIVFPSERLTVPLKFYHRGHNFNLDLFVFSPQEIKEETQALYLKKDAVVAYENKRLAPFVDDLIGKQKGYLVRYWGANLNSKEKPLEKIPVDPTF